MNLIPQIDVGRSIGNVWNNISNLRSPVYGDVIAGYSLAGGERNPGPVSFAGRTVAPSAEASVTPQYQSTTQQTAPTVTAAPNYSSNVMSALNSSGQLLDQRQANQNANLGLEYNTQRGAIDADRATGAENLTRQGTTTTRQKGLSIRDLGQNIRNAYQAGMNRLGASGAGDSSAAGMYAYALGDLQTQNQGKIMESYNYDMGMIADKQTQLKRDYDTKILTLDNWKFQSAEKIRDAFMQARDSLNQQRAIYGGSYVDAAQAQLAQQAAGQLSNVANQVSSASGIVQNDFANASAELQGIQQVNVNPNLGMQSNSIGNQNGPLQSINPMIAKKVDPINYMN